MHRAIRWSPHSTYDQQRFLVLNFQENSLALHEVTGLTTTTLQERRIVSHTKLPQIRAFEWSAYDDNLVAFGLHSGEAALLKVDGESSGLATIPIKHQRQCNSIAFSAKGLLATGLDKVRNDFCLNIWDINGGTSLNLAPLSKLSQPQRQLAMSEAVSSVKFFDDQPECLVAGVAGKTLRIFDLRESANPTHQYPTACVHNIKTDHFDSNYFISSSLSHPVVCVWDRRMGLRTTANSISNNGVSGTDPSQLGATITYKNCISTHKRHASSHIASLRYSKTKSGTFGLLSNTGELRVFETKKEYHPPWPKEQSEPLRTAWIRDIEPPFYETSASSANKLDSFDFIDMGLAGYGHNIVTIRSSGAIDVVPLRPPPPSLHFGGQGSLMIGNSDSQAKLIRTHTYRDGRIQSFNVVDEGSEDFSVIRPQVADGRKIGEIIAVVQDKLNITTLANHRPRSGSELHSKPDVVGRHDFKLSFQDTLTLSIGNIMRYRAEEGYRMNCAKNVEISSYDPVLQDMWIWVAGAQESAANKGMISGNYDLSYLGVMDVWNNSLGSNPSTRLISTKSPPTPERFSAACADINERCGRMPFGGEVNTNFPHQRQLCLAICGWALPVRQLEVKLAELEAEREYTKAAGWALFHGFDERAIQALSRGGKEMKIMSTAVAGFLSQKKAGSKNNSQIWKDLCYEMSNELEDKYARAIFAYVSNGDWDDVVHETSLPLRDRLGIALRFLKDDALTDYLTDLHDAALKSGDLEGIALTGITEATIPLMQSYIHKTGDIQTAVLVLSFACPLYFTQLEFDDWRAEYLGKLQTWRAFHPRAWYLLEHTKASTDRNGKCLLKSKPRQIQVGCGRCKQSLASTTGNGRNGPTSTELPADGHIGSVESHSFSSAHLRSAALNTGGSGGPSNPNICPHCKQKLPSCAVCLLPLGQPPHRMKDGTLTKEAGSMDGWFNFCVSCNHGYHAIHARQWFERHNVCAVADCNCICDR